jgi:polyferredoxin
VIGQQQAKPWLITFDTLAGQAARREGRPHHLRVLRPRTLIYASALAVVLIAVGVGHATRARTTLSLIHDRAPLFVRLRDGGIRNGFSRPRNSC